MKPSRTILALSLMLFQAHAERGTDAFYVWQQLWSSNVLAAVSGESATTVYPLATVVPKQGKSTLVEIPWNGPEMLGHRIVPVIRIPLDAFKRADAVQELSSITRQLIDSAKPHPIEEIQFDLDCPERLLPDYAELAKSYRRGFPKLRLSITALPAHLNNKSFRPLAETTDYYVLQVHGLDVPGHLSDPAGLLNPQTAERAIGKAEDLGHPYRIALPCYAYELNFDPVSGKFLFLTAEQPARRQGTVKKRIAANPEDLLALLLRVQTLKHAKGVIWFRLPVAGDRLCLPRTDLALLRQGKIPPDRVQCEIHPISDTTIELELFNENTIHSPAAALKLDWPQPQGAYDLYRHIHAASSPPGRLPGKLSVPMPPPGQSVRIGWFETAQPPTITIELQ